MINNIINEIINKIYKFFLDLLYINYMDSIEEKIKKNREKLSDSSIKTYKINLKSYYFKVYPSDKEINIKKFDNTKDFINYLKDIPYNKRKSILSALVVLTNKEEYKNLMMEDIKKHNENQKNQSKEEYMKTHSWLTNEKLTETFNKYKVESNHLFKIDDLTNAQLSNLQNFIILCLSSGMMGIPPRRSQDIILLKFRNYDIKKDNVYNGKQFIFNIYKTSKFYNETIIDVPKELKTILNKWIKKISHLKTDYLLFDSNENPLSNIQLNQRLNKIFDNNKISINQMRHTYLTKKYENMPALKDMEKTAQEMGHSLEQALEYVKK